MSDSSLFQSTLPREERPFSTAYSVAADHISIHAPTRGATYICQHANFAEHGLFREERRGNRVRLLVCEFFPQLLHGFLSCTPRSHPTADQERQSIHAPTRSDRRGGWNNLTESTLQRMLLFGVYPISIHAPTRGRNTTTNMVRFTVQPQNFNPRSHERSDCDRGEYRIIAGISIHAPTRGATAILHKKFVYFYTIPTINI